MTLLLVDELLHQPTPGLGHQLAVLLTDCVAHLGGLGEALLVSEGLAVGGEESLTAGLALHLAGPQADGGALLLLHLPALRLTDRPAGFLVD